MKTCATCKIEKPSNAFYPNPRYKGGVTSQCKGCARLYGRSRQRNKSAQAKEARHRYYLANADRINEATRLRRIAKVEECKVFSQVTGVSECVLCHVNKMPSTFERLARWHGTPQQRME